MAEVIRFPKDNPKYIIKTFIEAFGLEFPIDYEKFAEVMGRFKDGGTAGELYDALIETFPDKKESILAFPMYIEVNGELIMIRFSEKD
jgi:hypothetical protein